MKDTFNKWRERLKGVGTTAAYDELSFGPVKPGRLYFAERIAWEDENNIATDIKLYIKVAGYEHYLEEETTPVAGTLYRVRFQGYIHEGELLVVRFTGATAADVLLAFITGRWWEL